MVVFIFVKVKGYRLKVKEVQGVQEFKEFKKFKVLFSLRFTVYCLLFMGSKFNF